MKAPVARGKELGLKVTKDPNYFGHYWIDGIKTILDQHEANMVLRGFELALQHQKNQTDET